MADGVNYKISGMDELLGKLEGLSTDLRKKGGRFALRKAAEVIKNRAKQNALRFDDPETAELVAENVAIRWSSRRFKRTGDLMFRVGVLGGARATGKAALKTAQRRKRLGQTSLEALGEIEGAGKNNPGGDTYYWRFIEFGTEKTRAQPFLRNAANTSAQGALNEFVEQYGKSIDRAIKRAQKKRRR